MRWERGSATCNLLEPEKGQVVDATANTTRKTKGYALCNAVGELKILSNGIEEGVECGVRVGICSRRLEL